MLHNTGGLLTKVSGAWRKSDNTYLAKNSGLNNQFVPNANIALNAIGYDSELVSYFISKNAFLSLVFFDGRLTTMPIPSYCVVKDISSSRHWFYFNAGCNTPACTIAAGIYPSFFKQTSSFGYKKGSICYHDRDNTTVDYCEIIQYSLIQ